LLVHVLCGPQAALHGTQRKTYPTSFHKSKEVLAPTSTMAEEQPTTVDPPVEEPATPTEGNGDAKDGKGSNGKRPYKKDDLVDIETLYDLTKPIPKVCVTE
jgi:hypothetical protein